METYPFKGVVRVKNDVTYIIIPSNIAKAMKIIDNDAISIELSLYEPPTKPLTERILSWFETGTTVEPIVATVRMVAINFTIPQTKAAIIMTALVENGSLIRTDVNGTPMYRLKEVDVK